MKYEQTKNKLTDIPPHQEISITKALQLNRSNTKQTRFSLSNNTDEIRKRVSSTLLVTNKKQKKKTAVKTHKEISLYKGTTRNNVQI